MAGQNVRMASAFGVSTWMVYAIVECLYAAVLPALMGMSVGQPPPHWGMTIILFSMYPLMGLLLSCCASAALCLVGGKEEKPRITDVQRLHRTFAALMLVAAFGISMVAHRGFALPRTQLFIIIVLWLFFAMGLVACAVSGKWERKLLPVVNPWSISIILLGIPWVFSVALADCQPPVRQACSLFYPAVVLLLMLPAGKLTESIRRGLSPGGYLAVLLAVAIVVWGISVFANHPQRQVLDTTAAGQPSFNYPNVIMIVLDTVRADHLSLYGYKRDTVPRLAKFAETATVYTRTISPGNMTLTSHASIFTGMYPSFHGAYSSPPKNSWGRPLDGELQTLAELLSEEGFLTMGVVSNYSYLCTKFNLNQGFAYYDDRRRVPLLGKPKNFFLMAPVQRLLRSFLPNLKFTVMHRMADEMTEEAFFLIDRAREADVPFFLFLNYMDAHWPYIPPAPYDGLYPGKIDEIFTDAYFNTLMKNVMQLKRRVTPEERRALISQYDGAIIYMDYYLDRVFARLKRLGLFENSVIIITSDHGEVFGERDVLQHMSYVYQDQVHVPLIIKYPHQKDRQVVDVRVSTADIMPTVLDMMGIAIPKGVQGQNLLKAGQKQQREIFSESFPLPHSFFWHPRFDRTERSVFSGSFKFISSTSGKRELYNLVKDPFEAINIYSERRDVSARLEKDLMRWEGCIEAKIDASPGLSQDAIDRLKSMGYIQ